MSPRRKVPIGTPCYGGLLGAEVDHTGAHIYNTGYNTGISGGAKGEP